MHELSVCRSLLTHVERAAAAHGALTVSRVYVAVGPLSGVEPQLLERAWPLAVFGTLADGAELVMETPDVVVACEQCSAESTVQPNRLVCSRCGDYRTRVISGQEMTLQSLELETPDVPGNTNADSQRGRQHGPL